MKREYKCDSGKRRAHLVCGSRIPSHGGRASCESICTARHCTVSMLRRYSCRLGSRPRLCKSSAFEHVVPCRGTCATWRDRLTFGVAQDAFSEKLLAWHLALTAKRDQRMLRAACHLLPAFRAARQGASLSCAHVHNHLLLYASTPNRPRQQA